MALKSPKRPWMFGFIIGLLSACAGTLPPAPTTPAPEAAKPTTVVEIVAQGPEALAAPAPRGLRTGGHHLDQLQACAGYADFHKCVIDRLTVELADAPSHADLAVLIQSYMLTGQTEAAFRRIVEYLQRFPEGPLADHYAGSRPTGVTWDAVTGRR
jgi:hypothetical protein